MLDKIGEIAEAIEFINEAVRLEPDILQHCLVLFPLLYQFVTELELIQLLIRFETTLSNSLTDS
jgi:hypothetical protein